MAWWPTWSPRCTPPTGSASLPARSGSTWPCSSSTAPTSPGPSTGAWCATRWSSSREGRERRLDDSEEGCLSYPGAFVDCARPDWARVTGQGRRRRGRLLRGRRAARPVPAARGRPHRRDGVRRPDQRPGAQEAAQGRWRRRPRTTRRTGRSARTSRHRGATAWPAGHRSARPGARTSFAELGADGRIAGVDGRSTVTVVPTPTLLSIATLPVHAGPPARARWRVRARCLRRSPRAVRGRTRRRSCRCHRGRCPRPSSLIAMRTGAGPGPREVDLAPECPAGVLQCVHQRGWSPPGASRRRSPRAMAHVVGDPHALGPDVAGQVLHGTAHHLGDVDVGQQERGRARRGGWRTARVPPPCPAAGRRWPPPARSGARARRRPSASRMASTNPFRAVTGVRKSWLNAA